jgi:ABC-2 type transport system ATP-binding protein
MIQIESLTKKYGTTVAVNDISFKVQTGEILGFLGPNGAGKTTTMKVITCFMSPTEGNVLVDDLNVQEDSLAIRQKIGYLPEQTPLYVDMNVVDYLYYVAELREIPKGEKKKRIGGVIDVCGLGEMLHKNIGELSKGYRQRVGLAQAMVHDPEILVLDEPTIGLDPNQIVEIRNLIKTLGKEKTVILSTHILPEVQATCDRVAIINRGKIVADGTPQELQSSFQGKDRLYLELKGANGFLDHLRLLPGVDSVVALSVKDDTTKFQIETTKGNDVRERVFHLAVQQNWTLLEMHREQTSLEEVFRELTED